LLCAIYFPRREDEILVKVTAAAIKTIKKEVHDLFEKGNMPLIRLTMGIG
jgi:ribosomal protein L28